MNTVFKTIGLFAKTGEEESKKTLKKAIQFLQHNNYPKLIFEDETAKLLEPSLNKLINNSYPITKLGEYCDILIVIGGDGSILKAARSMAATGVPIIGINRGTLGFLTDIKPNQLELALAEIMLNNEYLIDQRVLLEASITSTQNNPANLALNDIVIFNGNVSRMIEFEVFIDDQFVMDQRSDGIIIATPTGSTAYSLSANGPILAHNLNVLTLVPMFAHTLTSRPIVINDNATIRLVLSKKNNYTPKISYDGQNHFDLIPGSEVIIKKYTHTITLLHPKNYNYFTILREKLGWHTYMHKT